jgi:hypothetical protein
LLNACTLLTIGKTESQIAFSPLPIDENVFFLCVANVGIVSLVGRF